MESLLARISSYNLFNYFFPGIVFCFLLQQFTPYHLLQENLLVGAFVYYFVGMVVSRFGSLVVESLLRKTKFVVFADYAHFIDASSKDVKIDLLSEVNNTYRTLISAGTLLLLAKLYSILEYNALFLEGLRVYLLAVLILAVFLFSYRKQTSYIFKRVASKAAVSRARAGVRGAKNV